MIGEEMAKKHILDLDNNTKSRLAGGENKILFNWNVLSVEQPIGEFYIASVDYKELLKICDFDVRQKPVTQ